MKVRLLRFSNFLAPRFVVRHMRFVIQLLARKENRARPLWRPQKRARDKGKALRNALKLSGLDFSSFSPTWLFLAEKRAEGRTFAVPGRVFYPPGACSKTTAYMAFDHNFRILRSIVEDPQDPENEIIKDFKVSIRVTAELSGFRSLHSIFSALRCCGS